MERHAPIGEPVLGGGDEAQGLVLGRGLRFADDEIAVMVHEECVRHGAAGIDAEHLDVAQVSHGNVHASVLPLSPAVLLNAGSQGEGQDACQRRSTVENH